MHRRRPQTAHSLLPLSTMLSVQSRGEAAAAAASASSRRGELTTALSRPCPCPNPPTATCTRTKGTATTTTAMTTETTGTTTRLAVPGLPRRPSSHCRMPPPQLWKRALPPRVHSAHLARRASRPMPPLLLLLLLPCKWAHPALQSRSHGRRLPRHRPQLRPARSRSRCP